MAQIHHNPCARAEGYQSIAVTGSDTRVNLQSFHNHYSDCGLELCYNYSCITLLHLQGIQSPAHFRCGWSKHTPITFQKITVLCLTSQDSRFQLYISEAKEIYKQVWDSYSFGSLKKGKTRAL